MKVLNAHARAPAAVSRKAVHFDSATLAESAAARSTFGAFRFVVRVARCS